MQNKEANITEIARKQRHLHLLNKVKQNKQLTSVELKELEKYEKMGKKSKKPIQKPRSEEFTPLQQRIIDCYDGDKKSTAKKANCSYGYVRQLLTKSNKIMKAIRHREETEIRPVAIADRQERQEFWSTVMRDEKEDMKDRLRASELLGRSEADFTENVNANLGGAVLHGVLAVPEGSEPGKWLKHVQKVKQEQRALKKKAQNQK